METAALCGGR